MADAEPLAQLAAVLAVKPSAVGGVRLRSPHQPARDAWLELLRRLLPDPAPWIRAPFNTPVAQLLGDLDLASTLIEGRRVVYPGVVSRARGGILVLSLAERAERHTAAVLATLLDENESAIDGAGDFALIALDEGLPPEDELAASLADRLGLVVDLRDVRPGEMALPVSREHIAAARHRLSRVSVPDAVVEALCQAAVQLGVLSLRASGFAVQLAKMSAALNDRPVVAEPDAVLAAQWVLAPRAVRREPPAPSPDASAAAPPPSERRESARSDEGAGSLEERVLAAAAACLPEGLLGALAPPLERRRSHRNSPAGKSGALRVGGTRGRAAGVLRQKAVHSGRINFFETLRAAAPWQALRKRAADERRVQIWPGDLRLTRFRQRTQSVTVFAVDASGSAAMERLAETKGAVELLLADCYVRRDQVAVIGFRGQRAEVLLPPTRSLVRARRSLAALPGGGGTPLAAAIDACARLVMQARRLERTPLIVLMTDGRANVARDGATGREAGMADAFKSAGQLKRLGSPVLLIDTAARAAADIGELARCLGARYLRMPSANSHALNQEVRRQSVS